MLIFAEIRLILDSKKGERVMIIVDKLNELDNDCYK